MGSTYHFYKDTSGGYLRINDSGLGDPGMPLGLTKLLWVQLTDCRRLGMEPTANEVLRHHNIPTSKNKLEER